ncbi:hypothetical protein CDAR_169521 [Caerostris darwini]|uniref:Uncharacterized protein n=1 Tax=Caerostris darwini TaxID=1538125 RepID=A0AAV4T1N6_9ARAC|nr:hypothetical protein CDAR_169521 [Caerostris darwini]
MENFLDYLITATVDPLSDNDERMLKNIHQVSEWVLWQVFAVEASRTLKRRGINFAPGLDLSGKYGPEKQCLYLLGVPEWRFHKKKLRRTICLTCFSTEFAVV